MVEPIIETESDENERETFLKEDDFGPATDDDVFNVSFRFLQGGL